MEEFDSNQKSHNLDRHVCDDAITEPVTNAPAAHEAAEERAKTDALLGTENPQNACAQTATKIVQPITMRERKRYAIWVSAMLLLGAVLYGFLPWGSENGLTFSSFFLGALLLASITHTIILLIWFLKRHSPWLIVPVILLSGLVLVIAFLPGLLTALPYYVYNIIKLIIGKAPKPAREEAEPLPVHTLAEPVGPVQPAAISSAPQTQRISQPEKSGKHALIALVCIAVIFLVSYGRGIISSEMLTRRIMAATGYARNSPQMRLLKEYCADNNVDLDTPFTLSYGMIDNTLFGIVQEGCGNPVPYVFQYGGFPMMMVRSSQSNSGLTGVRGELFTDMGLQKAGHRIYYYCTIDARTAEEKHAAYAYGEDLPESLIERIMVDPAFVDMNYADPKELRLTDETGKAVKSIQILDGKFIMYYGVVDTRKKDFSVTAEYNGERYPILNSEMKTLF